MRSLVTSAPALLGNGQHQMQKARAYGNMEKKIKSAAATTVSNVVWDPDMPRIRIWMSRQRGDHYDYYLMPLRREANDLG